jgi:hypothetical protein
MFSKKYKNVWITAAALAAIGFFFYFLQRDSDAIRQLKKLEAGPRAIRSYEDRAKTHRGRTDLRTKAGAAQGKMG